MGQTNCRYIPQEIDLPIYYGRDLGKTAWLPGKGWMIMRSWSPRYIHIIGRNGAIFQFRLAEFHNWESMLLTSSLRDTFWFFLPNPSIDKTMKKARKGQERYASRTSNSGYVCWGEYFEDQLVRLEQNLKEEGIELTEHNLECIAEELFRRKSLNEI